ncbi:hypothetical protein LV84_04173 [Algoriphagus ratkowskyi]|nr:hypothetical protein [Algoriphagus ratkowskyi]PZX49781.1 hypothetical protein LV84_04173 [Algoriphagus ratkowskyi]
MNRGFDFSDEGLYVLLADPNQQNLGGIFNYDFFFKLIHLATGLEFGIVGLRALRLLGYFLAAFGLVVFWKNIYPTQKLTIPVFILSLAGLFAGYGFLPPSLSYNSISVVAACLWLAIVSKKEIKSFDWVLLSLVFLSLFYSKITVCLTLGLLTFTYFFLKKSYTILKALLFISPFLIFEWLFYILFQENALTRMIGEYGFLQQREDYGLALLLKYTAVGGFWTLLAGILFFVAAKVKKLDYKFYSYVLILALISVILVFYFTFITSGWSHIVLLITFAGICWQLGQSNRKDFNTQELFFIAVLLLIPFLLHFGSNVYWMRLGIHYWVFWLLAFAMLIHKKPHLYQNSSYTFASFTSLVLVTFGIWITPYEGSYLWDATEKWEYKPGKFVYLSLPQNEFLSMLDSEIQKSNPSKIISVYRNPGLLYMLGDNPLYSPGYWKPSQAKMFLKTGSELDMILFNELEDFPFEPSDWAVQKQLIQPKGEKLLILWRK